MPLKPDQVREFYRLLRARGETAGSLAAALGLTNHTYVSRLVNGHGRRISGPGTHGAWWPRLRALLTAEEIKLIGGEAVGDRREAIGSKTRKMRRVAPVVSEPVYTFPTVRAAVAALPKARESISARAVDPTVGAFIHWKQQRRTA